MNKMYYWIKTAAKSREFREAMKHSGEYLKRARDFFQNIKSAKWLALNHRALDGDVKAQVDLAERYYEGRGAKRDYAMAFGWFLTAAEQGHAEAALNSGLMLYSGRGVELDQIEAGKWILRAAQQELESAQKVWKKIKPRFSSLELDEIRRRASEFEPVKILPEPRFENQQVPLEDDSRC